MRKMEFVVDDKYDVSLQINKEKEYWYLWMRYLFQNIFSTTKVLERGIPFCENMGGSKFVPVLRHILGVPSEKLLL